MDSKPGEPDKSRLNDPVFDKAHDLAAAELLKDVAHQPTKDAAGKLSSDETVRNDAYKNAVKSSVDAEANWRQSVPKGQTALTEDQIKDQLQRADLDPRSRGFLQFVGDNFSRLAGVAALDGQDSSKVTLKDVAAIGAMNEISPGSLDKSVKFLQDKFFELSGMDNKVTRDRVEKMYWDHSFRLFPQETQDRIYDLMAVMKSADQRPEDFDHNGKRIKAGLTSDEAQKLSGAELADNLRVQALQKWIFGQNTQKFESSQLGKDAVLQYNRTAQHFKELKEQGLDSFIAK